MFQLAVFPRVLPSRLHRESWNTASACCKFVATRDKRVQHDWFKSRVEITVVWEREGGGGRKKAWPANRDETYFEARAVNLLRGQHARKSTPKRKCKTKKEGNTRKLKFSIVRDQSMYERLVVAWTYVSLISWFAQRACDKRKKETAHILW